MATSRAAQALGLEHRIGTLTPGKAADIIAIDLKSFVETSPVSQPNSCCGIEETDTLDRYIIQYLQLFIQPNESKSQTFGFKE